MISAWWLLLLLPAYVIGHMLGYIKARRTLNQTAGIVRKLLQANNVERAIKLLNVVEGIEKPKHQKAFEERLKEMDE